MHSYGKILQKACAKDLQNIELVLELGGSLRLIKLAFSFERRYSSPKKITQNFSKTKKLVLK